MKSYIYIYQTCVFYEIILLSYFLRSTGNSVTYCTSWEEEVECWEGHRVKAQARLRDIEIDELGAFIIPGGRPELMQSRTLKPFVEKLVQREKNIFAICAGAEFLKENGFLEGRKSIFTEDEDVVRDRNLITSASNSYVDFALEAGKALDLFRDEKDFEDTVRFFKYFQKI